MQRETTSFDFKIVSALVASIGFIGSYYLLYSKIDAALEVHKEIVTELREVRKAQSTVNERLTRLEVIQRVYIERPNAKPPTIIPSLPTDDR